MGRIVIAVYKPKPGQVDALRKLVKIHLPTLRSRNLVTDRPSIMMEARDGTILEVFEWRSPEAIEAAHTDPVVLAMWNEFNAACDHLPVADLPEARALFADFSPLD